MRADSAAGVAWRILDECFPAFPTCSVQGLHDHQAHALRRLTGIISLRGGAILADSVGLGKTHVAAALARAQLCGAGRVLVTGPAHLREHWHRHMKGIPFTWLSHTSLSRRTARNADATLIIVDEAHAFRNPRTRRYASLALICAQARTLLLTATPVNNSLVDFYHLVRLFARRGDFADVGVPDLDAAVQAALAGLGTSELRRVADTVMVRRTRRMLASSADSSRRFPALGPIRRIAYSSAPRSYRLARLVRLHVPALAFPAHSQNDRMTPELLRLGLLKRLESSTWALSASVRRHIRILEHFLAAAAAGQLFDPRRDAAELRDIDGASQLSLHTLTLQPWPSDIDAGPLLRAAETDLERLRTIAAAVSIDRFEREPKLCRLITLLDELPAADRVVVFTEYRETAVGLWHALKHRHRVGLIHGSGAALGAARASRVHVLARFAPSHGRTARDDVRILVTTDVLAEGMNLQHARVVVSYDLPWNPIRIAQRIGRIDRLGSPHARIEAYAFVPDRTLDQLLGLMRRIRRKLRAVRVVGGDAPWSIAATSRGAGLLDAFDETHEAREGARIAWTELHADRPVAQGGGGSSAAGPAFGYFTWDRPRHGSLVCLRVGRSCVLVLAEAEGAPEIDTAPCWRVLTKTLHAADEPPPTACPAEALRAVRSARAALRRPRRSRTSAALDHSGVARVDAMLRRIPPDRVAFDSGAADAVEQLMSRGDPLRYAGPRARTDAARPARLPRPAPTPRAVGVILLRPTERHRNTPAGR